MRPGMLTMPETVRAGGTSRVPDACPCDAFGGLGGEATIVMMPVGR